MVTRQRRRRKHVSKRRPTTYHSLMKRIGLLILRTCSTIINGVADKSAGTDIVSVKKAFQDKDSGNRYFPELHGRIVGIM